MKYFSILAALVLVTAVALNQTALSQQPAALPASTASDTFSEIDNQTGITVEIARTQERFPVAHLAVRWQHPSTPSAGYAPKTPVYAELWIESGFGVSRFPFAQASGQLELGIQARWWGAIFGGRASVYVWDAQAPSYAPIHAAFQSLSYQP